METDSDSSYRSAGDSVAVSGSGVPSLHAAIMNLPRNLDRVPTDPSVPTHAAYARGHRDARHAAAELSAAHELTVGELLFALEAIANMPADTSEWDAVEKYDACRDLARAALIKATGAPHAE